MLSLFIRSGEVRLKTLTVYSQKAQLKTNQSSGLIRFGLVLFYGMLTFVGYLSFLYVYMICKDPQNLSESQLCLTFGTMLFSLIQAQLETSSMVWFGLVWFWFMAC